jgi:two-component sensor histidine kinase
MTTSLDLPVPALSPTCFEGKLTELGLPLHAADDEQITDIRQLRHQTKNALQRIVGLIEEYPGLQDSETGQALAADLQRRILLAAAVSDALFGFTSAPWPFAQRLSSLCEAVVALLRGAHQTIGLDVVVNVRCPPTLHDTVLRVAHEFVGNAVKHGTHARSRGRIEVRLVAKDSGVRLIVTDDGWGCPEKPLQGEGLSLARQLAATERGTVDLERRGNRTVAKLDLPFGSSREE